MSNKLTSGELSRDLIILHIRDRLDILVDKYAKSIFDDTEYRIIPIRELTSIINYINNNTNIEYHKDISTNMWHISS